MSSRLATASLLALLLGAPLSADVTNAGAVYCSSMPNSTGLPAGLGVLSLDHQADNELNVYLDDQLLVTTWSAPANAPAWLLAGPSADSTPFGSGTLCLGQPLSRIAQGVTTAGGFYDVAFGPTDAQLAHIPFAPGDWHFQVVYRDGANGLNLSDAVRVTMIP